VNMVENCRSCTMLSESSGFRGHSTQMHVSAWK
jgi:hypothetical protein